MVEHSEQRDIFERHGVKLIPYKPGDIREVDTLPMDRRRITEINNSERDKFDFESVGIHIDGIGEFMKINSMASVKEIPSSSVNLGERSVDLTSDWNVKSVEMLESNPELLEHLMELTAFLISSKSGLAKGEFKAALGINYDMSFRNYPLDDPRHLDAEKITGHVIPKFISIADKALSVFENSQYLTGSSDKLIPRIYDHNGGLTNRRLSIFGIKYDLNKLFLGPHHNQFSDITYMYDIPYGVEVDENGNYILLNTYKDRQLIYDTERPQAEVNAHNTMSEIYPTSGQMINSIEYIVLRYFFDEEEESELI